MKCASSASAIQPRPEQERHHLHPFNDHAHLFAPSTLPTYSPHSSQICVIVGATTGDTLMNLRYLLAPAALLAASLPAFASTVTYQAILRGTNEVPANASTASGVANLTLNGNLLTIDITFTGIQNPAAAAHIHCCAPIGTNAPVVLPFAGFPSATSGTYNQTVDLSTFAFSGGGSEAALLAGFANGQTYVNIHDAPNFSGGEIRGQVFPTAVPTPEPGTLLLTLSGLAGMGATIRRKLQR